MIFTRVVLDYNIVFWTSRHQTIIFTDSMMLNSLFECKDKKMCVCKVYVF